MKRIFILGFSIAAVFMFTACSLNSVRIQEDVLKEKDRKTSSILYSKSFFQERFMGKEIAQTIAGGLVLVYLSGDYNKRQGERIGSGDFEKLLNDFDVMRYFDGQFRDNIGRSKILNIEMEKNPERASQIAELIASEKSGDKPMGKLIKPNEYVAAFKVSYGIGVRSGSEQIGFRKYYRPFIMLIGRVKHAGTQQIIWQEYIIAFKDNPRYLGNDASADKIKKEELVSTFKDLTKDVIDMTIRSLNGEKLPEMPEMAGLNKGDGTF